MRTLSAFPTISLSLSMASMIRMSGFASEAKIRFFGCLARPGAGPDDAEDPGSRRRSRFPAV
jgi:hypothetical protein